MRKAFTTTFGTEIPASKMEQVCEAQRKNDDWQWIAAESDLRDCIQEHDDDIAEVLEVVREAEARNEAEDERMAAVEEAGHAIFDKWGM